MKTTLKLFSGLLLLLISLQSCNTESDETTVNATELEEELSLQNNGVLKIEAVTYIFKDSGKTAKFISENKEFDFEFKNQFSYQASAINKHAIEGLTITNPETEEFIKFSNFEELKNGFIMFDAELSTGQILSSVMYKPGKTNGASGKWHGDPMLEEPSPVIGAMIELSQQEAVKQCRAASQACSNTNGVPTVALTNGKGWFTAIEACSIECHD